MLQRGAVQHRNGPQIKVRARRHPRRRPQRRRKRGRQHRVRRSGCPLHRSIPSGSPSSGGAEAAPVASSASRKQAVLPTALCAQSFRKRAQFDRWAAPGLPTVTSAQRFRMETSKRSRDKSKRHGTSERRVDDAYAYLRQVTGFLFVILVGIKDQLLLGFATSALPAKMCLVSLVCRASLCCPKVCTTRARLSLQTRPIDRGPRITRTASKPSMRRGHGICKTQSSIPPPRQRISTLSSPSPSIIGKIPSFTTPKPHSIIILALEVT